MSDSIGLESLLQRGRSVLYVQMTSLYQEVQDALYDAPEAKKQYVVDVLKKINFRNKLKDLINKEIGPILKDVLIVPLSSPTLYAAISENTKSTTSQKSVQPVGFILENINKLYNDKLAKFSGESYLKLAVKFTITISTAIFQLREKDNAFYFSPEELAAITLHEVGHIDDFIRNLWRIRIITQDASDIITYIHKSPDEKVVKSLIENIRKSEYLDKSWKSLIDLVDDYFSKSNNPSDSSYFEAINILTTIVTAETTFRCRPLVIDFFAKTNRISTRLHAIDAERAADEFSARNGAYSALASGLHKFDKLTNTKSDVYYRTFMRDLPAEFFKILSVFKSIFSIGVEDVDRGYDPMIRRMALIVETAKHAFHDEDLPPEVAEDIKRQIAESEEYIKQYDSTNHRKIRKALFDWKENMNKFGRIIISPFHNRLSQNYERLQDATRTISRHPFYYLSKK